MAVESGPGMVEAIGPDPGVVGAPIDADRGTKLGAGAAGADTGVELAIRDAVIAGATISGHKGVLYGGASDKSGVECALIPPALRRRAILT